LEVTEVTDKADMVVDMEPEDMAKDTISVMDMVVVTDTTKTLEFPNIPTKKMNKNGITISSDDNSQIRRDV